MGTTVTKFSELNIKIDKVCFVGKSIEIDDVLGKSIRVHHHKIGESKFKDRGNGKCLTMQIEFENEKRVIFSGSGYLMGLIEMIPADKFPFDTIIIKEKESKRYLFS